MDFEAATRHGYDAIAEEYAERFRDELAGKPFDRALLAAFAELVVPGGRVLDVGSGPGQVTAHLAGLGCHVVGVDLSPRMVDLARRVHPGLAFQVGSMSALDLPDGSAAGIVVMYSIIHVPIDHLPAVFAELHRVLAPGAPLLAVFQTGGSTLKLTDVLGTGVSLEFRRHPVDTVVDLLASAGLTVTVRAVREPAGHETTQQAYLVAGKMA